VLYHIRVTARKSIIIALVLAPLVVPIACLGQAGPPMIANDPNTPGNGIWEINVPDISAFYRSENLNQIPFFDIHYGVGERVQLKLEGGYSTLDVYDSRTLAGPGTLLAGVKWRFLDQIEDGFASISLFPQFTFHPFYSSKDASIAAPGNNWMLPLELSRRFGLFFITPEAGYEYQTLGKDFWFYGLVAGIEPKENLRLMAEVHGDDVVFGGATDLLVNFGLRYPLGKRIRLLASAGHTLRTLPEMPPHWISYLGLQFRL